MGMGVGDAGLLPSLGSSLLFLLISGASLLVVISIFHLSWVLGIMLALFLSSHWASGGQGLSFFFLALWAQ